MIESLLAVVATFGSPVASPAAPLAVISSLVVADEIAATDDLPSLDDVANLPDHETAMQSWRVACEFRKWIYLRAQISATNCDGATAEVKYRERAWDLIADASNPSFYSWNFSSFRARREKLALLRDLVGDPIYFSGAWPAPCPFIPRCEVP